MMGILVVEVKGHGMTDEILGAGFETELFVDKLHVVIVKVNS
jgi:hypothetical protein